MVKAKNNFYAIAPDGATVTRKSHAEYTHVVIYQPDIELIRAFHLRVADDPSFKRNFEFYAATSGSPINRRITSEGYTFEKYRAEYLEGVEDRLAKQASEGYFDRWFVLGWSSRKDLALKNAALVPKHHGRNATILETRKR